MYVPAGGVPAVASAQNAIARVLLAETRVSPIQMCAPSDAGGLTCTPCAVVSPVNVKVCSTQDEAVAAAGVMDVEIFTGSWLVNAIESA
jgi:hypothetical protein